MKLTFKNFGHAIAVGAKYFIQGLDEVVKGAAKIEGVAPEVDLLVGAVAGPQAAAISDLAGSPIGLGECQQLRRFPAVTQSHLALGAGDGQPWILKGRRLDG